MKPSVLGCQACPKKFKKIQKKIQKKFKFLLDKSQINALLYFQGQQAIFALMHLLRDWHD